MTVPNATDIPASNGYHDYPDEDSVPSGGQDWSYLFQAPDYSSFIKRPVTAKSREYEKKVASLLKAGMISSLNNQDFADAAAFIKHGPGFAAASGMLAESSDKAAALIDMITTPANPVGMFIMTAIPMFAQLFRNHEEALSQVPGTVRKRRLQRKNRASAPKEEPKLTVKFLGRRIGIRVKAPKIGKLLAPFRSQSVEPDTLIVNVFQDAKVQKALHAQGIHITFGDPDAG